MIDREALLADLQALLKRLEADLLDRSESDEVPDVGRTLHAEFERAKQAERTAANYEDWRSDAITQAAAAWVLSCVFVRFLEDNLLISPPRIAGPKERLQMARDEHEIFFRQHPRETDRDYLLAVFDELADLPGTKDVFGEHNPIRELPNWLSGDAASGMLRFFQKINADTGDLVHDFTDHDWDTRFLGDLYQDLSEAARKKYALLQTPEFVEEFILDRTLDPAIEEFGLVTGHSSFVTSPNTKDQGRRTNDPFKMIDPACGSGHFLLGAFRRILERWQKQQPGDKIQTLVQKTLDSIHGVDVNPYAVAIARFRLLLAAMQACAIPRLADASSFHLNLACGDSLYHGRQRQQMLGHDWTDEAHYFASEDAPTLRRMLRDGTYHCVVANPPYITPKDRAANDAYRKLYPKTCHMKYSLAVPFMERIYRLAIAEGFTGQITANSFMKREFGRKVIEDFLPTTELTHVIDSSGAYFPGYGTPTVILFGRSRSPVRSTIRAVMGIRGEPSAPRDASQGKVWTSITNLVDIPGSENEYISVADLPKEKFYSHPWTIGGGGASELKVALDERAQTVLSDLCKSMGIVAFTLEDDVFLIPTTAARRRRIKPEHRRKIIVGDVVRDWLIHEEDECTVFPYDAEFNPINDSLVHTCLRHLWLAKTNLRNNKLFAGKTKVECGVCWYEFGRLTSDKLRTPMTITFPNVATHNHFVYANGSMVFKDTAPILKLSDGTTELEHRRLVSVLNSSVACFWMKQVLHDKGGGGIGGGLASEEWERFYQTAANALSSLPVCIRDESLDEFDVSKYRSERISSFLFHDQHSRLNLTNRLDNACEQAELKAAVAIRLQEDLDWKCYCLYGLLEEDMSYPGDSLGIQLGERAFEIVLARKIARGEALTTWFVRHGSKPITDLPNHWPDDYKQLVQRRIDIIASNSQIALLEQPQYKRRWSTESWDSQVERALRLWLLDRLESYFDFDRRMSDERISTEELSIALTTVTALADTAARDRQFMEAAEVYRDDQAFDVQRLVAELVQAESVSLLPVLRYKPSGLRKRAEWEKTWDLQRREDAIDARTKLPQDDPQYLTEDQARNLKRREIGEVPVPPKYTSADFISSGGARYWALRGKLDVPKERWISFPHCEGPDGTLVIAWAGYDHLQLARAISAYYVEIQEHLGGRDDPRLVPLLACIIELLPWLRQWHHDLDPDFDQRMDEFFEGFIAEEAKALNMTIDEVKRWQPPTRTGGRRQKGGKA